MKTELKICSRGHKYKKSKATSVCPKCWPGFYKKKAGTGLPSSLPAPALRALLGAKLNTLAKIAKRSEKELLALHGMGKSSIPKIKTALKSKGLSLKK